MIMGGDSIVSNLTAHSVVDFKQILMSCLNLVIKVCLSHVL